MRNNFQRLGSTSNSHVGRAFEERVRKALAKRGLQLTPDHKVPCGLDSVRKNHSFDLGSENPRVIVECKSHTWTSGGNIPSAKITVWNEAMLYFLLAPKRYRKILFVLRDFSERRGQTLAEYYIRNYGHLIPDDVEVLEYGGSNSVRKLR